jgi:hypothetical protein
MHIKRTSGTIWIPFFTLMAVMSYIKLVFKMLLEIKK